MTPATLVCNSPPSRSLEAASHRLDEAVRGQLTSCSYGFAFNKITWRFDNGQITLRGSVPSYYLKQVLQERLRRVPNIGQIRNEVQVVNARGLSSESMQPAMA